MTNLNVDVGTRAGREIHSCGPPPLPMLPQASAVVTEVTKRIIRPALVVARVASGGSSDAFLCKRPSHINGYRYRDMAILTIEV